MRWPWQPRTFVHDASPRRRPERESTSAEEAERQRGLLRALLAAYERSDTLLTELSACEDVDEASALLQRELGVDELGAATILDMQLRRFPRSQQRRIRADLGDDDPGAG